MSLTSEPPRFNHSLSNTSTTSFIRQHQQQQPPTHSSPTSTSSTGSSVRTSSSSDRLGSSSLLGSESSMVSLTSAAGTATTATTSPATSNKQHTNNASPAIQPNNEPPPPQPAQAFNEPSLGASSHQAGGPKSRRASTTSSESNADYNDVDMSNSTGNLSTHSAASSSRSTGTGTANGQRPHRKAARMGSFEARPSSRQSSAHKTSRVGNEEDHDGDDEADGEEDERPKSASPNKARTPSSAAANAGAPTPNNNRRASQTNSPRPNTNPSTNHVDIVSYPSADLLRLLASLLEQIAHANDALHQRTASASGSRPRSGQQTPGAGASGDDPANAFERGVFDAAPLNSPITPLSRPHMGDILMRDRDGNDGQHGADNEEDDHEEEEEEMPVTPGVDLLREVGAGGGVDGFMPSLGGTHYPLPLARRRGSSFLKARDETTSSNAPSYNRTKSSGGSTATGPSISAAGALPGSIPPGTTPPVSNNNFPHSSTSANGQQQQQSQAPTVPEPPLTSLLTASSVALSSPSATLCFHARNIPAISVEAYLLRILKYCPTTNEVFLSLLVYFDRMARVGLEAQRIGLVPNHTRGRAESGAPDAASAASKMFAIDSFNIHRLVIAGVTVASKFFSDVFYTNSRYAKVGGLPLNELNQLELQFLLLNDFRLVIPTDELQRYADQLILYWVGRNASPSGQPSSNHPHPGEPRTSATHHTSQAPTPTATQPSAPLTADAVATQQQQHTQQQQQHAQQQFTQPRRPSPGQHVGSSYAGSSVNNRDRPRSVRSQPSSSGTSVTSTITPGTPSTPRGGGSSSGWGDDSTTEDGSEAEGAQRGEPMEED